MSTVEAPVEDTVEVLEPSAPNYEEEIGGVTYTQKPLSFFGKIEFFSVLADGIERALSEGISLGELLDEIPDANTNPGDLREADVFIKALAKVLKVAPDLLTSIYAISLGVKRNARSEFFEALEDIEDEQAVRILNHFIDQNWDAVMDFFSKQVNPLIQNVSEKLQSESTPLKPSKASPRRTAKI
jgi:hypothetical protein